MWSGSYSIRKCCDLVIIQIKSAYLTSFLMLQHCRIFVWYKDITIRYTCCCLLIIIASKSDLSILRAFNLVCLSTLRYVYFISIAMNIFFVLAVCWLFFFFFVRHFNFGVVAFKSYLYALLIVQPSVNSCLLLLLCISYVAFVMIQFVAFNLFAMTELRVSNLFDLW